MDVKQRQVDRMWQITLHDAYAKFKCMYQTNVFL